MYNYISKEYKTLDLTLYYIDNYNQPSLYNIPKVFLNYELCEKIINKNSVSIEYIFDIGFNEEQILKLCTIAIKQDIKYGMKILYTKSLALELIKINPTIIQYIENQDINIVYEALKLDPEVIQYVNIKM